MKTTAHYRKAASEAETQLNWKRAAELWQSAIDAYPGDRLGVLARRDITMMEWRMRGAQSMMHSQFYKA